jgi:hypothetical protein
MRPPPPPLPRFALEDADSEYQYGMECLFRFYSYGLERAWNESLYMDFEALTLRVRGRPARRAPAAQPPGPASGAARPMPASLAWPPSSRQHAPRVQDFEHGSLYGLEKFWAFHHYTGFPKDQPQLEMHAKVGWGWGGGDPGAAAARGRPAWAGASSVGRCLWQAQCTRLLQFCEAVDAHIHANTESRQAVSIA